MRKVCVFTATRAEYGILKPLLALLRDEPGAELQLLVSGTHLSREFGHTVDEIRADGFVPSAEAAILDPADGDGPAATGLAMARGVEGYTRALGSLAPDILVLLGDRYEIFAAAAAATALSIPIAHLHGGESTEGAMDEAFRHAITKMSHLHFTCAESYRQRVVRLGESPDRVFDTGSLSAESIATLVLPTRDELEASIGFRVDERTLLTTFHPETLAHESPEAQFSIFLRALDRLSDTSVLFTKANADAGGRAINAMIDAYVEGGRRRCVAFTSMGQLRYLGAMRHCGAVVGNSSSGILEAPSFGVPTVNIGDRQKGRVRAAGVIDCPCDESSIVQAVERALSPEFRDRAKKTASPFYKADTARNMCRLLLGTPLDGILKKAFYEEPRQ